MDLFATRSDCPICRDSSPQMLVSVPYTQKGVLDVLVSRYEGNITAEDLKDVSYELLFCGVCNFVFQKYVPSEKMVEKLYSYQSHDRISESFRKRTSSKSGYYMQNARVAEKALVLTGKKPSEPRAFEYGAGWGYFSLMLKAFGFNVTALEVSDERIENLKKLAIPSVRSAGALSGQYDYAHSDQVFEHLADPLKAFQEIAEHVDGGLVYIAVPNGNTIRKRLQREPKNYFMKDVYPLEHINCFSNRALQRLAKKAGFTPVPFLESFPLFLQHVSLRGNLHLLQEAIKFLFTQKLGTAIYFRSKN